MMVFVGLGGNGDSQINGTPPYDNIWPHSSSLEHSYRDEATGLTGYISDDQLTSHTGVIQCWTDASYQSFDDCASEGGSGQDDKPVFVRVGPYNVNPESAIDAASVISHEYGHHLGLPDFYSNSYSAYNDWNLMAGDYSQHMTIFSKQEMGWVVPTFLQPGQTVNVTNWKEIKNDTGTIRWQRPDGTFYTLSAANGHQNIHNGQAFALKLPRRLLIDPTKVEEQASAPYLWYSGRGNDFGCAPLSARNLDIRLDELADLTPGTPVTLTYKSSWDIEWDFDYGFTMVTTNGEEYATLPSAKGYTTPATTNPNGVACQEDYGNGLTGQSGAYEDGPAAVAAARAPESPSAYSNGSPFLTDEYDLSAFAGMENVVLRFSYSTDPGFDRPGWFIDDLKVAAGSEVLYQTDFTEEDDLRIFPGGCLDGQQTAVRCTEGWSRIKAGEGSVSDHAYYIELRDRSGFDANGRGQSDRGDLGWAPGALIEYTDEVRGYGNTGGGMPPRQHYIDSQPQPGFDCGDNLYEENPPDALTAPRCQDAAFTAAAGDSHFDDDPAGGDWIDNFADEESDDGLWHFDHNCLSLDVTSMSGGDVSASLPSNLTANATITALAGCAPFRYTDSYPNSPPTAEADAKPPIAAPNQAVTFDGSGSTDDRQVSEELTYRWDFTNNGSFDATGQVVNHAYPAAGTYTARLRVIDANGKWDEDTVSVIVRPLPDLIVAALATQNINTSNGRRVRITATIRNIGTARIPESRTAFKLLDETVPDIGFVRTPALAAGETRTISIIWDARQRAGDHRLKVVADHPRRFYESNDRNNKRMKSLTVRNGWVVS
jgi:PKD repeat protein